MIVFKISCQPSLVLRTGKTSQFMPLSAEES
ncbi:hypothetical protein MTATph1_CDS0117 [Moorella phage MTATph1]